MRNRESVQQLHSVHARHNDVGHDRIDRYFFIANYFESLGTVDRFDHSEAFPLQNPRCEAADRSLIVDYHDDASSLAGTVHGRVTSLVECFHTGFTGYGVG
jgi:hypothetical protein